MKAIALAFSLGVLLTSIGCSQPTDDTTARKITVLETRVATLEQRNNDLALKGRIVSSQLFRSPLENFFASDEFWENPYDSGQADCAKRCISTLTSERRACENIVDDTQRLQCFQAAVERASRCQTQCSANNPPPLP